MSTEDPYRGGIGKLERYRQETVSQYHLAKVANQWDENGYDVVGYSTNHFNSMEVIMLLRRRDY